MKQRLISAGIGLIVLLIVLIFFNTAILNTVISLIGIIAVNEILHVTGSNRNKFIVLICTIMSAVIPFLSFKSIVHIFPVVCYIFVISLFIINISQYEKIHIEKMAISFMVSLIIPFSVYIVIYIRDLYFGTSIGIFYIIMALGSAWLSDSGAYFVGRSFGKNKLSPKISPNKTIEGAIGGIVICTICLLLIGLLYQNTAYIFGDNIKVNYLHILITTPISTILGILGDLSASLIKRQYGVKDYGNIMPGHGGIMDRFDSVLMVLPMILVFVKFMPFVTIV